MIANWLIEKLTILPGLLIALSFHEFAHGFVAHLRGDDTAKRMGRLTLDPLKHIDPVGFLMLFIVGFGWAKPVPVDFNSLKNRKIDTIMVAISGSFMNFFLAIVGTVLYAFSIKFNFSPIVKNIFESLIQYNLIFGVFNLLPFPPLDGSKVVISLLPTKYEAKIYQYERYFYLILIVLIITKRIGFFLNGPINLGFNILINLAKAIVG